MKTLIRICMLALIFPLFFSVASSAESDAAAAVDISGKWAFTVETPQGPGSPSFVFTQKGETLTGTYTGFFGTAPLTGTVEGAKVTFVVKTQSEGQEISMIYSGEVAGETMKGKVDFTGLGEATFTGKRAP
jgi:hypothetical protein